MNLSDNFRFDTCSWINLSNGGVIDLIFDFLTGQTAIVAAVEQEMDDDQKSAFDQYRAAGNCGVCDTFVDAAELQEFVRRENIGQGEAHSILACRNNGLRFVCDDRKARNVAIRVIGEDNVIGSVGLLCALLAAGLLSRDDALATIGVMVARGAFLPAMQGAYWDNCERGFARLS